LSKTVTIRVDPSVQAAVEAIANSFKWTTSDVASTLIWVGLLQVNPDLLPGAVRNAMFADMLNVLRNFFMMSSENPTKALDNLQKTVLLLSKSKSGE
jgi:hypothetical protein